MIYTSYFANWRNLDRNLPDFKQMSISKFPPRWYKGTTFPIVAPPKDLLMGWKSGEVTKSQYITRYINDVLMCCDVSELYKSLDGRVLLCYEKPEKFCHRHILSAWFRWHGYEVEEFGEVELNKKDFTLIEEHLLIYDLFQR